jgi:hypothetical protein
MVDKLPYSEDSSLSPLRFLRKSEKNIKAHLLGFRVQLSSQDSSKEPLNILFLSALSDLSKIFNKIDKYKKRLRSSSSLTSSHDLSPINTALDGLNAQLRKGVSDALNERITSLSVQLMLLNSSTAEDVVDLDSQHHETVQKLLQAKSVFATALITPQGAEFQSEIEEAIRQVDDKIQSEIQDNGMRFIFPEVVEDEGVELVGFAAEEEAHTTPPKSSKEISQYELRHSKEEISLSKVGESKEASGEVSAKLAIEVISLMASLDYVWDEVQQVEEEMISSTALSEDRLDLSSGWQKTLTVNLSSIERTEKQINQFFHIIQPKAQDHSYLTHILEQLNTRKEKIATLIKSLQVESEQEFMRVDAGEQFPLIDLSHISQIKMITPLEIFLGKKLGALEVNVESLFDLVKKIGIESIKTKSDLQDTIEVLNTYCETLLLMYQDELTKADREAEDFEPSVRLYQFALDGFLASMRVQEQFYEYFGALPEIRARVESSFFFDSEEILKNIDRIFFDLGSLRDGRDSFKAMVDFLSSPDGEVDDFFPPELINISEEKESKKGLEEPRIEPIEPSSKVSSVLTVEGIKSEVNHFTTKVSLYLDELKRCSEEEQEDLLQQIELFIGTFPEFLEKFKSMKKDFSNPVEYRKLLTSLLGSKMSLSTQVKKSRGV